MQVCPRTVGFFVCFYCLHFLFQPCSVAYAILVPWPGIKPVPLELGVQSVNHWTAREVLVYPRVEGQVIVDVLPWVGKIPWRRAWPPTPVFLPGESPWTEEPGGLQSMGLQRVTQDWSNLACSMPVPSSRGSSLFRDWARVSYISCIDRQVLYH